MLCTAISKHMLITKQRIRINCYGGGCQCVSQYIHGKSYKSLYLRIVALLSFFQMNNTTAVGANQKLAYFKRGGTTTEAITDAATRNSHCGANEMQLKRTVSSSSSERFNSANIRESTWFHAPICKSLNLDQWPIHLKELTYLCRLIELLLVKSYWGFLQSILSHGHEFYSKNCSPCNKPKYESGRWKSDVV